MNAGKSADPVYACHPRRALARVLVHYGCRIQADSRLTELKCRELLLKCLLTGNGSKKMRNRMNRCASVLWLNGENLLPDARERRFQWTSTEGSSINENGNNRPSNKSSSANSIGLFR